ncbi:bacteriochlorophyll 4-vinyl reductase [Thetidibacter halocola]|uniref:Bacteriochlorophyll 4-vinyl reductase n=1 Tax=Thetidibacter halocola TaxID=2827239 RepID=A0A8J8B7S7_9RHOB|nr:bacteriochlorophyll 4-vinyl reductase [Thetidibacter halocola]MBS0123870.1 bacteriochlorophyll 4-vinyl reductase [Thetidibacter halocola]
MPRDLGPEPEGLIGPNAVLQVIPVLDRAVGPAARTRVLARWGGELPDGSEMIPEGEAASLHHVLRAEFGPRAPGLAAQAGRGTAEYILAHRIPRPAQAILRALPASLAARALSKAIAKNAWTFAGSGRFEVLSPWSFAIHDNPVIRGEASDETLCHWHAAVFETLYRRLVHPAARCREVACAAAGAPACRFEIVTG